MSSEETPVSPIYDERYCAFIDVLGFSELIGQLRTDATGYARVRDLLGSMSLPPTIDHKAFTGSDLRAQSISDAICISTAVNNAGLSQMFFILTNLVHGMLLRGFFVRGAIVKGNLYHDNHMVFGEAQIRAYQLERDVARFPRIMIAREVVSDVEKGSFTHLTYRLRDFIAQSDDGPRHLDVLGIIPIQLRDGPSGENVVENTERYNAMARQIQTRLDESRDNPKHFEKVQWFARYWNRTVLRWGVDKITRESDGNRVLV